MLYIILTVKKRFQKKSRREKVQNKMVEINPNILVITIFTNELNFQCYTYGNGKRYTR